MTSAAVPAHPELPDPLVIEPLVRAPRAVVDVPGSKSITNRALVAAALANGSSVLHGALVADDTEAMIGCLEVLGARVTVAPDSQTITVYGTGGRWVHGPRSLDARQSGTTARFLLGATILGAGRYTIDGHDQLRRRPFAELITALGDLGVTVVDAAVGGGLPVTVEVDGPTDSGGRRTVTIAADTSSQFASGLLLAGPALPYGLIVELAGEPVSVPYLDLTVAVMRDFGATIAVEEDPRGCPRRFVIEPGGYSARRYDVEPDASAASYFFAAAAVTGGRVTVRGLDRQSAQGDTRFVEVLEAMGCRVADHTEGLTVVGTPHLRGITVDLGAMSDLVPTLGAVAPFAEGPTSITGVGFIRTTKESDRVGAMVTELGRAGIAATIDPDGLTIDPGTPEPTMFATYDDHRIAMALALIGLRVRGVAIADPGCVAKTFPAYFATLDTLRVPAPDRVLAIDGPAGSGKSTAAQVVADRVGLEYLDTGAMYRAVAFAALHHGVDPADRDAVAALARRIDIHVGRPTVTVDGLDATEAIRGPEVTVAVSTVAANPAVRAELVARQRAWVAERGGGVVEGRDIGSVVFPDAVLKLYLTARPEIRAIRRAREVSRADIDAVAADLDRRDTADSNRATSPLLTEHDLAPDVVVLDTSDLDIDQVVDRVVELLDER